MSKLQEIIEILSSGDDGITNALIKTKVFLYSIGKKELATWVNHELNGYSDKSTLPDYRIVPARILVNADNGMRSYTGFALPLGHLPSDQFEEANRISVIEPIGQIEHLVTSSKGRATLKQPISLENAYYLAKSIDKSYEITECYKEIALHNFTNILTQVRSRLLDFLLEFSDQAQSLASENDIGEKMKDIDAATMFNNAIFGPNAVINFGNKNSFNISNRVNQNDFKSLETALLKEGLTQEDVDDLKISIAADGEIPPGNTSFGPKVSVWFSNMITKAAESTWGVGVETATTVLTSALKQYFGLN